MREVANNYQMNESMGHMQTKTQDDDDDEGQTVRASDII